MLVNQVDNDVTIDPILPEIKAGEERAFRAWPAKLNLDVGGWIMRHTTQANNRRTNSVCPKALDGSLSVDDLIKKAELFYGQLGLPVRYQISPACEPSDLDDRLQSLGYEVEAPVLVQWATCEDVLRTTPPPSDVHISDVMDTGWHEVHRDSAKDANDLVGRRDIIERIEARRALVLADHETHAAAKGLGVFESDWCGIFCMHTLPAYRRLGLADRVLAGLADWTKQQGGTHMYLQVEKDNAVARSFYAARGFSTAYCYHYHTRFQAQAGARQ